MVASLSLSRSLSKAQCINIVRHAPSLLRWPVSLFCKGIRCNNNTKKEHLFCTNLAARNRFLQTCVHLPASTMRDIRLVVCQYIQKGIWMWQRNDLFQWHLCFCLARIPCVLNCVPMANHLIRLVSLYARNDCPERIAPYTHRTRYIFDCRDDYTE